MVTRPKLIAPFQIGRGMATSLLAGPRIDRALGRNLIVTIRVLRCEQWAVDRMTSTAAAREAARRLEGGSKPICPAHRWDPKGCSTPLLTLPAPALAHRGIG